MEVTAEAEEVAVVAVVAVEEEGVSTTEITRVKPEAATEPIETTLVKPEAAIDFIAITVVKVVKPKAAIETIVVKPEITTLVKSKAASAVEFTTAPACLLC